MKEGNYNQKLRQALVLRGFEVIKHSDRFTKGVPDLSATKNKKTLWLETKVYKAKVYREKLNWNVVLGKEDMVQLDKMIKLQRAGHAFYVLIWQSSPREYRVHLAWPSDVLRSVRQDVEILLGAHTTFEEMVTWV